MFDAFKVSPVDNTLVRISEYNLTNMPKCGPLFDDIKTAILVVGAGMSGLSIAYELIGAGHDWWSSIAGPSAAA